MLLDEMKVGANLRDAKGWTPVAVAAFRGHKKVCQALVDRRGNPEIQNAYRKSAFDVAQDDEIVEVLKRAMDQPQRVLAGSGAAAAKGLNSASASSSGAAAEGDDAGDAAEDAEGR